MKEIMKRAWEIIKEAIKNFGGKCREYLSEALRIAWAEKKEGNKMVDIYDYEKMESLGFKRWTKNGKDRFYINTEYLGLKLEYYKSGNIQSAWLDGYSISNCQARRLLGNKNYVDLIEKLISSTNKDFLLKIAKMLGVENPTIENRTYDMVIRL